MRLGNPVNTTPFQKKLSGVTVPKGGKKRRTTRKKKGQGRKK